MDFPQGVGCRNGGAVGRLPGLSGLVGGFHGGVSAAMEGQSGDCPDRSGGSPLAVGQGAAMEGQSGDCPDFEKPEENPRFGRAAMEGQSGDCPDTCCAVRKVVWAVPQWRGSRETARTQNGTRLLGIMPSCRNGGAVGRLPGHRDGSNRIREGDLPQWRGSRETARTKSNTSTFETVPMPQWRGSRETARTHKTPSHPPVELRRNGGAVGRLPGLARRPHAPHTPEPPPGQTPPQGRGSREPARTRRSPRPTWWSTRRNGGAVGRLPGRDVTLCGPVDEAGAAMEGQSGDCPDIASRRVRYSSIGRNGGAVGRLPGPDSCSSTSSAQPRRNGGAVGRLPGPETRTAALKFFPKPQWRGSRETARTLLSKSHQYLVGQAAMEGQSGDCPDVVGYRQSGDGGVAAMEGQSGDCPDVPATRPRSRSPCWPQWRGSRETARTHDCWEGAHSAFSAAMEGQSGDCPDEVRLVRGRHGRFAAMEGQSGDCPDVCDLSHHSPLGVLAAMEGQSGDCPDVTWSAPSSTGGLTPQWRGSRETARTSVMAFSLAPAESVPQWRGSRETARTTARWRGRHLVSTPQWRGSRETARTTDPAKDGRSTREPQWRGSRETARTWPCGSSAAGRVGAAMEGQSGDCPDRDQAEWINQFATAAMEGQSGDCPDFPNPLRELGRVRVPQWRGSRETARTPGRLNEWPYTPLRRNGGAVGRLPGHS